MNKKIGVNKGNTYTENWHWKSRCDAIRYIDFDTIYRYFRYIETSLQQWQICDLLTAKDDH